ncbi:uroporphyrinogen decarboxylase family protein [Nibricoccus sp. IMCC34717]|uniref:uroporphyrinogen decarboxylase family protein n=1 Tax=Nibricoccus sp. IMCC34717 TaxID=3034021 RepID=UPI00384DF087
MHAYPAGFDPIAHDAEAAAVWAAYKAGRPIRTPVVFGTDTRFFLLDPAFNPDLTIGFKEYSLDADVMMDVQLRAAVARAHAVAPYCDDPAQLPEVFKVTVDLQRYADAGFFGAHVDFKPGQTPDTVPMLTGDRKRALFDVGRPDPLTGGVFSRAHALYTRMRERVDGGYTFLGRPVAIDPFGTWTDGPVTVATNLRGTELYEDMYDDPEYVHELLDFIVEGTIARVRAHRRVFGLPEISTEWMFADDSIMMLSADMVDEFVLPAHRKLRAGLTSAERIAIHLCGDATRHYRKFRDELGVYSFDTGFPVDFGKLRVELGPEVEIYGGPNAMLMRSGTSEEVRIEAERILRSGIREGGKFILREGNDLAPCTPHENLRAVYEAAHTAGTFLA